MLCISSYDYSISKESVVTIPKQCPCLLRRRKLQRSEADRQAVTLASSGALASIERDNYKLKQRKSGIAFCHEDVASAQVPVHVCNRSIRSIDTGPPPQRYQKLVERGAI